jgi:hypothetical protein
MVIEQSGHKGKHKIDAQYMVESLNTNNIWTIKIFIAEIVYFINVLGNIYCIGVFLGIHPNDIFS